ARNYATPADSFVPNGNKYMHLPPPAAVDPGQNGHGSHYLPPMSNIDLIDLTAEASPSKRRRKDNQYDKEHNLAMASAYIPYQHPPSRSSPPTAWNPAPARTPEPVCDKEGFFIVTENCQITPRYDVLRLLGQGTFGKVLEVYDREEDRNVAIKVVRALQKYTEASRVEIKVLQCLEQNDPYDQHHCIPLLRTFTYRNHTCMVFPLLSQSVFDYLKENSFVPLVPWQTGEIALQLVDAVVFMHSIKLIHTDLKPENIMIVNNKSDPVPGARRSAKPKKLLRCTEIALIDFGSAIFEDDYHSTIVSTRHYRAPEILLGSGWSYPCDIWSLGCILVEFVTGDALFQTHENIEHLAMMEQVLGPFPAHLTRPSPTNTAAKYFRDGQLLYPRPETTKQSKRIVTKTKLLRDIVKPTDQQSAQLLDLIYRMLRYDPTERITAVEALRHPYFDLVRAEQKVQTGLIRHPHTLRRHTASRA
ncbi:dual specificity protein kinase kns1, partial [Thoreauomyces humboldtii]